MAYLVRWFKVILGFCDIDFIFKVMSSKGKISNSKWIIGIGNKNAPSCKSKA